MYMHVLYYIIYDTKSRKYVCETAAIIYQL